MAATGRKRVLALVLAGGMALAAGMGGGPVSAETIDVPIGQSFVSGAVGSTAVLGGAPVPAALVGRSCSIEVTVTNQESIHPGNALVVTSGSSTVTVAGIEEVAGSVTTQAGVLTLADSISVGVQFGNDGISSLGSNLKVTCAPLPVAPPPAPVVKTPTYTG